MLNYDNVVSKFELQSRYYVHFWTDTFSKRNKAPNILEHELDSTTIVLLQGGQISWIC